MATDSKSVEHPLVSITMPAYNYGHYVEQAVRSAWEQDYPHLELIAVDDGSTDDTMDVLQRLSREAPFPMKVLRGEHRGVCAAMNLALDHVQGDYVCMLHADDFLHPQRVSMQMEALLRAPDCSLVHSEYVTVDEEGCPTGSGSWLDLPPAQGEALRDLLSMKCDVRSPTMLMRRAALEEVGRYDESLTVEDHQSILRLAKHGRIAHVDEPLVYRRIHATNVSHNTGKGKRLRFEEFAYPILREVTPSDMNLDAICALHAGVTLSNAIAQGGWSKARHGLLACWKEFPGGRRQLLEAAASGARSYAWMRWLMPLLPSRAVATIRALKSAPRHQT